MSWWQNNKFTHSPTLLIEKKLLSCHLQPVLLLLDWRQQLRRLHASGYSSVVKVENMVSRPSLVRFFCHCDIDCHRAFLLIQRQSSCSEDYGLFNYVPKALLSLCSSSQKCCACWWAIFNFERLACKNFVIHLLVNFIWRAHYLSFP